MNSKIIEVSPIITEKSLLAASKGRYTFKVGAKHNKNELRKEIERLFNVKVSGIAVLTVHGKTKKLRNKRKIRLGGSKKAIVKLAAGKIGLFEKR